MKLKFNNIKKLVLKNKIICLIIITILIVIGCIIVYKSYKTIEKFNDNCDLTSGTGDCNNLTLNFYDTDSKIIIDKTFDVDLSGIQAIEGKKRYFIDNYPKYIFHQGNNSYQTFSKYYPDERGFPFIKFTIKPNQEVRLKRISIPIDNKISGLINIYILKDNSKDNSKERIELFNYKPKHLLNGVILEKNKPYEIQFKLQDGFIKIRHLKFLIDEDYQPAINSYEYEEKPGYYIPSGDDIKLRDNYELEEKDNKYEVKINNKKYEINDIDDIWINSDLKTVKEICSNIPNCKGLTNENNINTWFILKTKSDTGYYPGWKSWIKKIITTTTQPTTTTTTTTTKTTPTTTKPECDLTFDTGDCTELINYFYNEDQTKNNELSYKIDLSGIPPENDRFRKYIFSKDAEGNGFMAWYSSKEPIFFTITPNKDTNLSKISINSDNIKYISIIDNNEKEIYKTGDMTKIYDNPTIFGINKLLNKDKQYKFKFELNGNDIFLSNLILYGNVPIITTTTTTTTTTTKPTTTTTTTTTTKSTTTTKPTTTTTTTVPTTTTKPTTTTTTTVPTTTTKPTTTTTTTVPTTTTTTTVPTTTTTTTTPTTTKPVPTTTTTTPTTTTTTTKPVTTTTKPNKKEIKNGTWKYTSKMPRAGKGGHAIYSSAYSGYGNIFLPSTRIVNQ